MYIMKKITSLFTLLLLAFCSIGASAETTVTIVDGTNAPYDTYGTRSSDKLTFTSNAASGLAGVTITLENGQLDRATWWNTYCLAIKPGATKTATKITITAPAGYVIADYSMTLQANTSNKPYKVSTTLNEDNVTTNGTDITGNPAVSFRKNVFSSSTNFTIYANFESFGNNNNFWLAAKAFTITLVPEEYKVNTADIETGYYYLFNMVGGYLDGSSGSYAWKTASQLTGNVGLWYIQNLGAGSDGNIKYYIQVKNGSNYFGGTGVEVPLNATRQYQRISVRESGAYYTLSGHQDVQSITNKSAIKYNGTSGNLIYRNGGTITDTSFPTESQWIILKAEESYTYNIIVTGSSDASAGVQYNGNTYSDGDSFTTSANVTASDFTANTVTGYTSCVKIKDNTIYVTYFENIDFTDLYVNNTTVSATTDPIVEGQWYMLTQVRNINNNNNDTETPAYDVGTGSTIKRAAVAVTPGTVLAANTPAGDISQYLLRFVPTGMGNGYYIQFATGNFWNGVSTTSSVSSAGSYLVYNATHSDANYTGWAINATSDGVTYGSIVDNNGQGNNIGFWGTGQVTNGTNNVWKLYPVELGALISEVTYNVTITDGTNSKTVSNITSAIGTSITAADYLLSSQYITSDSHEITLADEGQTITLNCAFNNLPFTLSADPSDVSTATYYYMTLKQHYCATNVATASSATFDDDNYLWAFGGSPVTGITVYNKAEGKYMNVGTSADNSKATFSTTPTFYTIKTNNQETNGFSLNVNETNAYINHRDGYVSTWLDARGLNDRGSCLRVYTEDEEVVTVLPLLLPYFSGCVGGITLADYSDLHDEYTALLATPTKKGYYNLVDDIDNALASRKIEFVDGGYYWIQNYACAYIGTSRGGEADPNGHFMTVNSSKTAPSCTKVSTTMEDNYGLWKISSGKTSGKYVIQNARTGKYIASQTSLSDSPVEFNLVALNGYQYRIGTGNAEDYSNICDGHNSDLVGWSVTVGGDGAWLLIPEARVAEVQLISPSGVDDEDEVFQAFSYRSNVQMPDYVGVHYISTNNGNFAHIETVTSSAVRANEGYIIKGVKGSKVPMLPTASVAELSPENMLIAVVSQTPVNSGYMLAYKGNDAEPKFYKIKSSGFTIPANRSYLPAAAAANVRGLELLFGGIGDDEITGIDGINTGGTEGAIFDLQGRRVTKPEKGGIYIINGKKVMK